MDLHDLSAYCPGSFSSYGTKKLGGFGLVTTVQKDGSSPKSSLNSIKPTSLEVVILTTLGFFFVWNCPDRLTTYLRYKITRSAKSVVADFKHLLSLMMRLTVDSDHCSTNGNFDRASCVSKNSITQIAT